MIKQLECFKLHKNILTFDKVNHDFIGVATKTQNIKIFSTHNCQKIQNIYFDLLGEKTTALAFHPSLDLIAIANGEKLYILSIKERNIIQTIITQDGIIQLLSFIDQKPYLISGTANGRVMQYRYDGRIHISRLCSFPYTITGSRKNIQNNYVSVIAHNNIYVACSGFGNAVTIIKFNSQANKISFEVSKAKINALTFLNNNQIAFTNVEGILFITKIKKNTLITQLNTQARNIIKLLPLAQSNYILIISKATYIILFNTKTNKIIKRNFLTFEKEILSAILLNENELLVTFLDNSAKKIFLGSPEILQELLKEKKLIETFELLEANPMLMNTAPAKEAEALYLELYSQIALELFQSNNEEDLEYLQNFTHIKTKKNEIQKLLLAYKNYPKLQHFYQEYKFPLAYALCENFPPLKLTPLYKEMEDNYKKSFVLAQKQLLSQKVDAAKRALKPFATVHSKRAMIQLLLRQNKEFLSFIRAIAQKDYKRVDILVKTSPIFKEIPSFIALQEELFRNLHIIRDLIKIGDIPEAINKIKKLQYIPMIKKDLETLYSLATEAKKLLYYYENNYLVQCYELIDANSDLEFMNLAQLLEEHWNTKVNNSELFALQGDIKAIKDELDDLIHITTRKEKIGDLLRLSFHAKIKNEIQKDYYKSSENLIYSYIDIFGIDSEINQIMKIFEKTSKSKLAITFIHKKRNSWKYTDIS
jgi:hypothetical protein